MSTHPMICVPILKDLNSAHDIADKALKQGADILEAG